MQNYIGWCNDYNKNTGEGKLARKFIKIKFSKSKVKVICPKVNFFLSNYILQFFGIFVLWYYYFAGKKLIYINYLPLWNTFIFLLSPPGTRFGPITGSIQINKIKNLKSFFRFYTFPVLYKLNLKILLFRLNKIIFATNILKKYISKNDKKKVFTNFVLSDVKFPKENSNYKKYDYIIYYRKHENKFFSHHYDYIRKEINKGKKIIIVGDKINLKGVENLGIISSGKLTKFQKKTKYTLSGDDNVLSLFNLECAQNGVKIIFNYKLNFQIEKLNKYIFIPYNYNKKKFVKY